MYKNTFTLTKGFKLSSATRLCTALFCLLNIASSNTNMLTSKQGKIIKAEASEETLKSDTFKYADPTIAKNISITIKGNATTQGKTKSGKKWIAFSVNQLDNFQGKKPADILEAIMIQNPTARESFEMTTREDIEGRIALWNERLSKGYPHSGLLIYTDDNPKDRKLIGFVVTGGSTVRYYGEFAILLLPEYLMKNQTIDYRASILERFFVWGKEVRDIGLGNPKNFKTIKINSNSKENDKAAGSSKDHSDQELKKQIRALFCFAKFRPLEGLYSTCDFNDNWLKPHMRAHRYKVIPHVIADFRENFGETRNSVDQTGPILFSSRAKLSSSCKQSSVKNLTEQEFLKILSDIVPSDRNPYSVYLPDGTLATIIKNKYGLIKFAYDYPVGKPYEFKMQEKIVMPVKIVQSSNTKEQSSMKKQNTLKKTISKQTVLF